MLELVHFQITKNCNLRCWFCGQWGKKGFFSDACGEAMEYDDWKEIVAQLVRYREETGASPDVMLWGGEPLLCPYFADLVTLLRQNRFELGIVTNGVLIDQHIDLLKREFRRIYVSVDGDEKLHDTIRGQGVFQKVKENLARLRGTKATVSIMTVLSPDCIAMLERLPEVLCGLDCDEVILQEMITLSKQEACDYKQWMQNCFGISATEIDSWIGDAPQNVQDKEAALQTVLSKKYPKPVRYLPHGVEQKHCNSPFSHMHIAWNGNVLYCTDFYDFSAGNVKESPLMEIFENERSRKYREEIKTGNCATCRHCSWRNSDSFRL